MSFLKMADSESNLDIQTVVGAVAASVQRHLIAIAQRVTSGQVHPKSRNFPPTNSDHSHAYNYSCMCVAINRG